ncbi:MAG: CapA family protein [Victivallales bacterium]|nr:CapA family protein [Victivallales bacterium]
MGTQKLTVTGTGDSLFVTEFPREYDGKINTVADFIQSCDVKLTNLETNLSDFEYYAGAYSGGTWLNTRRSCISELLRYGFNYFGNANNHAFDYSYNGLLSTIETLDRNGLAHSGTGRSLEEAGKPAILEANGLKTAVFAVDASFEKASKAGRATKKLIARPGVNYLRHEKVYKVTEEEMAELKKIAASTRINFDRERSIATGYKTPDPEGYFFFGEKKFTTKDGIPATSCNEADLTRITDGIKEALKTCDYAFVLIHCHDNDSIREENPPAYLTEFAHACLDAGASAIFGGGCHRLRGLEMYKGLPIFYSLGDFIYQGLKVEHLPADFMEAYSINIYSTAEQALYARSRGNKVGLHCNKKNYQTLLPKLEFQDGKLTGFAMLPVYLNFDRKDDMNGLPEAATGAEATEIFELMQELSAPFGVKLAMEDGLIRLA